MMGETKLDVFTVRIPEDITHTPGGTIEVKSWRSVSHRADRGDDLQMMPDEYAAFCDLMLDKTIRWTADNAATTKLIKRDADLYLWWNGLIEGPLAQVPIGSDQFRESRAGLIHPTFMNSIRKAASLSPADFKSLSLVEVFAVICDIHCREHNEENRQRRQANGGKSDSASEESRFTKKDLCKLTGYTDGNVNQRLKALDIAASKGGRPRKGDKPFSRDQVERLLKSIIDDNGAQQFNKNICSESLKTLQ